MHDLYVLMYVYKYNLIAYDKGARSPRNGNHFSSSNGFCKCVYIGYVQMLKKTINLFSRAGMRNEWSSRISAMLDITIEDEFLHMCATSAHVDCHYWRRPLKIVRHSGSWPYRH